MGENQENQETNPLNNSNPNNNILENTEIQTPQINKEPSIKNEDDKNHKESIIEFKEEEDLIEACRQSKLTHEMEIYERAYNTYNSEDEIDDCFICLEKKRTMMSLNCKSGH